MYAAPASHHTAQALLRRRLQRRTFFGFAACASAHSTNAAAWGLVMVAGVVISSHGTASGQPAGFAARGFLRLPMRLSARKGRFTGAEEAFETHGGEPYESARAVVSRATSRALLAERAAQYVTHKRPHERALTPQA